MEPLTTSLAIQAARLLLLQFRWPSVLWTVTHEEVFREPREYCQRQTRMARSAPRSKVLLSVHVHQYMSIYSRLRLDIKHENLEIKTKEGDVERRKAA